jgi:hypothetical protein
MTTDPLPELNEECFFIAPIGAEGSETRERSDGVMEYIVGPAAQAVDLTTIRADKIAKPGQITRQVIEHVVGAKAAVVDLTGANPNVYYEMAVRHTAQVPTVLIAQNGEKLPFDISQMRTIFFDHTSLKSAAECRDQITQHLQEALGGEVDSPIAASVSVQRLEQGSPQDRVLAQIIDGMDDLRKRIRMINHPRREIHPRALADLDRGLEELLVYRDQRGPGDPELDEVVNTLTKPIMWIGGGRGYRSLSGVHQRQLDAERQREDERELERDAERQTDRDARQEADPVDLVEGEMADPSADDS